MPCRLWDSIFSHASKCLFAARAVNFTRANVQNSHSLLPVKLIFSLSCYQVNREVVNKFPDSRLNHDSYRLNIHEHFPSLRAAFKSADRENLGYLRKVDLRRILFDFNFLLDDDQFDFIMKRCGMEKKTRMSYDKFLKFFESPQSSSNGIENFETIENR